MLQLPRPSRGVLPSAVFRGANRALLFQVQRQAVLRRAKASGRRVLLAILDTTTCNFDMHHSLEGLGAISSNRCKSGTQGLHVYRTLLSAADEDAVFGLLVARRYAREVSRKSRCRALAIVSVFDTRRAWRRLVEPADGCSRPLLTGRQR